jgi:hypothetical protein
MRLCLTCRYLSPRDALYCGHCARSFGGRRCPHHHLSPPDANVCIRCGAAELSEAARSLSVSALVQGALVGVIALALVLAGPSLLQSLGRGVAGLFPPGFAIRLLDRVLGFVLITSLLLHLVPGELGKVVRQQAALSVGLFLSLLRAVVAGAMRLLVAVLGAGRSGKGK